MYNVEYLPSAMQDMVEIVVYIARELNNPTAAEHIAERLAAAGKVCGIFRMRSQPMRRCVR